MAQEVCVVVGDGERARLVAIAADRNHAQKHVQRARIILLSAERLAVAEVARQAGVSRPAVWRWQARYAQAGVDGLLRDKTRPPGRAPVPIETMAQVLALTCSRPPGQATHWTGRAMAKATGISLRSVQRIWDTHRLQPHRLRTFKHANDPAFAEKMEDIVGLYMDPPMHTVVLSMTRSRKSRRSTAHSRGCRSSPANAAPGRMTPNATVSPPCSPHLMCRTAPCWAAACLSTGIRNTSASSTPSSAPFRQAS
jgi:Homeodomain-like domain